MISKKIILFIGIFIFVSLAFASANGCCVYASSGICSQNVKQDVCVNGGGKWDASASCNIAECTKGCCILGSVPMFINQRECQGVSSAKGFTTTSWQASSSSASCSALVSQKEMGACIYNHDSCSFIEKSKCAQNNFNSGKLCSDLNTRCNKTSKTKCFDDGVYYLDSCGNRDALVKMCNYKDGFTCRQKSSSEAYCKDLNCVVTFGTINPITKFLWKPKSDSDNKLVVLYSGVRGVASIYGADGKLIETGVHSTAAGTINGYGDGTRFSKPGSGYPSGSIVIIGTAACAISNPSRRVESCVKSALDFKKKNGESWCAGGDISVGSEFFKQICIDGEVVTEPCAPYRNEICVSGGSNAQCVANHWEDCLGIVPDPENPSDESWKNECDSKYCYVWEPEAEENFTLLLEDLHLEMCLPKIPGGQDLSGSSFSTKGGVCSFGDYIGKVFLDHDAGPKQWYIKSSSSHGTLVSKSENRSGNAGLISLNSSDWEWFYNELLYWGHVSKSNPLMRNHASCCDNEITWCCGGSEIFKSLRAFRGAISDGNVVDPLVAELLDERSTLLGDCAVSTNWVGKDGSLINLKKNLVKKLDRDDIMLYTFSFITRPFRPPTNGDCSLCGKDGLPCSEYRCKAIGRNCEYKEPRGIDSGVCVSSNDFRPPSISHSQNPTGEIPPFSPVVITLTTDEDSYCKFDFGSVDGTIDGLRYETSKVFAREHKFVLNVPGRARYDGDFPELPLLTRDGNYTLFVRCEDGKGNYNVNPYLINLEVMDTPDSLPADILTFYPPTNSFVKYNTTEKEIRFKLNEPAECRWDFEDKEYEQMGEMIGSDLEGLEEGEEPDLDNTNQFNCEDLSEEGLSQGYFCSGTLTNVTLEIGKSTKYFIRCKDQPWLEENNPDPNYYSRNVNPLSKEYVLKPSSSLTIIDFYPLSGDFFVGGSVGNITYGIRTKDGAERGKASCEWRVRDDRIAWAPYSRTNSSSHEVVLTSLQNKNYFIETRCEDIAGNKVNMSSQLNIIIDNSAPVLTRVYNDRGNLKISLDEKGKCKFVTKLGCYAILSNGTLMSGSSNRKEFSTNLIKATPYYIKCSDDFGNSKCYEDIVFF